MNAEAITNSLMDVLREKSHMAVDDLALVRMLVYRSTDSVICGLSPWTPCGDPVPELHNERCTLPRGHAGDHALWTPSFESASEAHAAGVPVLGAAGAGVQPDGNQPGATVSATLAARLCHEPSGLLGDPEAAEVVARWLMRNYSLRELPHHNDCHTLRLPAGECTCRITAKQRT